MSGNLFDVFVVGSTAADPTGDASLARALAARHRAPVDVVARAIAAKNLRAGQGLGPEQAQSLVRQLQALGAVTVIRPSQGAPATPTSQTALTATPPSASFQVPARLSLPETRAPVPRPDPTVGDDPFAAPGGSGPTERKLELDLGGRSSADLPRAHGSLAGASAMNLKGITATSSASGLSIDDATNAHSVRCTQHGLYFDKRKASGCRKCLASAREVANTMEAAAFRGSALRADPVKRAFIGLTVALVVGFLPAAYQTFARGAGEVRRLRAEQEILSGKPATEAVTLHWETLDQQVNQAHHDSAQTTAILWLLVTGGALAGWYRVT